MPFRPLQQFSLVDGQGRSLGHVVVNRIQGNVVFGQLTPSADYASVEPLFAEYVEAANQQMLSIVGELDEKIAALGLRLHSSANQKTPSIFDVQIGEGIITFRTHELASLNDHPDMRIHNEQELAATREKLRLLEERIATLHQQPASDHHLRELTLRSLKSMINQFREEIARFELGVRVK